MPTEDGVEKEKAGKEEIAKEEGRSRSGWSRGEKSSNGS